MDSRRHVGNTSQLDDVSELVLGEPPPVRGKQSKHPGISTNEHAAAEAKLLRKTKTALADGPVHQSGNGERSESDGEEPSPVEKLRRKTVKRMGAGSYSVARK